MLGTAISITATAFENVTDKGGSPYILHCLRVMNRVAHLGETVMCAAIMHDLVEDGKFTVDELEELGFDKDVRYLVWCLTHHKSHSYDDYIKVVSVSKEATAIKLADLIDNSDITRLKGLSKKDFDRMEKYHKSYVYLSKV